MTKNDDLSVKIVKKPERRARVVVSGWALVVHATFNRALTKANCWEDSAMEMAEFRAT